MAGRPGDSTKHTGTAQSAAAPNGGISTIEVAVSPGELIDKISILQIKSERIADSEKLKNVMHAFKILQDARHASLAQSNELSRLESELKAINEALWDIEDEIRACEAAKDFGPRFIELARSVYKTNDRRAATKKKIDELFGSALTEEKSYQDY